MPDDDVGIAAGAWCNSPDVLGIHRLPTEADGRQRFKVHVCDAVTRDRME